VGARATLAYAAHENTLISHDLLRIEPIQEQDRGWIYAYLLAPQTRAMTKSVHYGHIIKWKLRTSMYCPFLPSMMTALDFSKRVTKILERNIYGNNEITCGNSYCPLYEGVDFYCS